jgi:Nucleoporin complex subunit 54
LYAVYTGDVAPNTSLEAKKNFVAIVYNDVTQEQRQMQWLHGMGSYGNVIPMAPPKPPQVSEEDWHTAVALNPDPMNYMPVALVGADALSARLLCQQDTASQLAKAATTIQNCNKTAKDMYEQSYRRLEKLKRDHYNNRSRLLKIMKKVQVVLCINQPLQQDEVLAVAQLRELSRKVNETKGRLGDLENLAKQERQIPEEYLKEFPGPQREKLSKLFTEHAETIKKLNAILSKDIDDVELIKKRVIKKE